MRGTERKEETCMYEGIKNNGKVDLDFELGWFTETIELICDGEEAKAREVLRGMFCGVLQYVTGYKWLEEPPAEISVKDVCLTTMVEQSETGKNHSDILGNWNIIFRFEPCDGSAEKRTTKAALVSVENAMERFVRARYHLEEPKDLAFFVLEEQRTDLIEKHFTGWVE